MWKIICMNLQNITTELSMELNIGFNMLEMMVGTPEYCKVYTKWVPKSSNTEAERTPCARLSGYWTNARLRVSASWTALLLVARLGVTTTSQSQNDSSWSGNMWIPHQRKGSSCSRQWVIWCALSFRIGKGWSFWFSCNLDNPSTCITTPQHRPRLKLTVRPEKATNFLLPRNNARPHTNLKSIEHNASLGWTILPHPLQSSVLAPSEFHLFGLMKDRLRGQHFSSNDAVIAAVKWWVNSSGADFYKCGT